MFDSIWDDIRGTFSQQKNVIPKLITANIIVFVLINGGAFNFTYLFSRLLGYNPTQVFHFFALPNQFSALLWQPWTLVTYGFLHNDFWHILYNMLFLYWLGNILQEYLGNKKVLTVFFFGIMVSGLAEIITYELIRLGNGALPIAYTVGASGAVMAILAASATLLPDYSIRFLIFDIRLKYIFLFYFLIDLLSLSNDYNWGGHITHLAGAFFGFLYIKDIYRHGYVDGLVDSVGRWFGSNKKSKPNLRTSGTYKTKQGQSRRGVKPNQQEIDEILDKISHSGYDSLTRSEKDILFAASED